MPAPKLTCGLGVAFGQEAVGLGEPRTVAIGGGEKKADLFTSAEAQAIEIDVLQSIAGEQMQGRIEAQQLLHLCAHIVARGEAIDGLRAVFEQRFHRIADGVDRGFVPGVQQQDGGNDHLILGKCRSLCLRRDQSGQKIVGRLPPARLHITAHESW